MKTAVRRVWALVAAALVAISPGGYAIGVKTALYGLTD